MTFIYILIGLGLVLFVRLAIISNRKVKPYRTDYTPQPPNHLTREELTIIHLVNKHRKKKGLNELELDILCSNIAFTHCKYMVDSGVANHDNFPDRSFELSTNNAKRVGEVVADGFNSPKGFINGYKKSNKHKGILEGDFTHIGASLIKDKKNFNVIILAKY